MIVANTTSAAHTYYALLAAQVRASVYYPALYFKFLVVSDRREAVEVSRARG